MAETYQTKVRAEKVAVVDDIAGLMSGSSAVLLTEYRGLTVGELAALRDALAQLEASYRVVKNTLALLAARQNGIDGLDETLEGPTALAYCQGDPVAAAKVLATFAREHPALVIKGAILEGRVLSGDEASALATVDPLEISLAKIMGLLTAPLQQVLGLLEAPMQQLVYMLEQLAARPDESGGA